MNTITRIVWRIANWLAQLVFAARIGWRDGYAYRDGTRPNLIKEESKWDCKCNNLSCAYCGPRLRGER